MAGIRRGTLDLADNGTGRRGAPRRGHTHEDVLNRVAGAAARGEPGALEHFLELVRVPVLRYCRARIGSNVRLHTPDDVAQEVLIALCDAVARYRVDEVPAMAFVYGIARNKVADALRASQRDHSDPTDQVPDGMTTERGPEATAELASQVDQLRAMLEQLPPAQREVLVLRVAMQFSADEAARAVGSTPGAVRVTQHRALTKLREMVAKQLSRESDPDAGTRRR